MARDLVYLDSTLLPLTDEMSARIESTNISPVKLAGKEEIGTARAGNIYR